MSNGTKSKEAQHPPRKKVQVVCPKCGVSFLSGSSLTQHLRQAHSVVKSNKVNQFLVDYPEMKLYCFWEYQRIKEEQYIGRELIEQCGEGKGLAPVRCRVCGWMKHNLRRHIRVRHPDYEQKYPGVRIMSEYCSVVCSKNNHMDDPSMVAKHREIMHDRGHYLPGSARVRKSEETKRARGCYDEGSDTRRKMSESAVRHCKDPKERERRSKSMKEWCKTPKGRAQILRAIKRHHELYDFSGSGNPMWNGGDVPAYGYNWSKQNKRALERANSVSELSGNKGIRLNVHHTLSVKKIHLKFLEICYPCLFQQCLESSVDLGMFEQGIVLDGERIHYKGIPVVSVFPRCFYDEMNRLDYLFVLTVEEHPVYEGMPPTFFEAIRRENECYLSEGIGK